MKYLFIILFICVDGFVHDSGELFAENCRLCLTIQSEYGNKTPASDLTDDSTDIRRSGISNIHDFDFQKYLTEKDWECLEIDSSYNVNIESIIYFDFNKDGRDEAIITAQTCMMGTGGPDIHSVYYLDASDSIREYEIDYKPKESTEIIGVPMPLIGNRNYYLQVKDSLLCAVYWDGSGRKHPLSQYFKFENGKFVLEKEVYGKTFPTSFDCSKAKSDREIVACSCDSIAEMDLELDSLYRVLLSKLNPEDKSRLRKEQLEWLQDFDKVYAYKWLNDFSERYRARIEELKNELAPR